MRALRVPRFRRGRKRSRAEVRWHLRAVIDLFDAVKRHTKRIVASALLGIAGAAFCVDRFVLGYSEPRGAAAATESPAAEPGAASAAPSLAAAPELGVGKRIGALAERMPVVGNAAESDAMVIPAAWHVDKPEAREKPAAASVAKSKPEFPKFVLTSVIGEVGDSKAAAMVNGGMVRVGSLVEGYTVTAITPGKVKEQSSVTLSGAAGEITIEAGRPVEPAAEGGKAGKK